MDNTSPPPSLQQRSFFVRLFRSRLLRGIVFVILCLVTLAFLVLAEENWRGRRAWEKFRQEWEAKGERFDLSSFIPKPVPPEENFLMTPFLAPLTDYEITNGTAQWRDSNGVARVKMVTIYAGEDRSNKAPSLGSWPRGEFCDFKAWQVFFRNNTNYPVNPEPQDPARDVLFAFQKYEPVLAELRAASQRPYAMFPIHNGETFFGLLQIERYDFFKTLTQVSVLRALASLEAGRNEEALADVKLAFHFHKSLQSEPTIISQLVRLALIQISIAPVWEGLAKHRWSEAQLEELQKQLASLDLLEDYGFTMRGERAWGNEMMAQYRTGRVRVNDSESGPPKMMRVMFPTGWFYQNQLVINRLHQELTLPAVDAAQHRVYPEKLGSNSVSSALGKSTPYNIFARMLFPAFERTAESFARTQAGVDLATVACALERYRIANAKYPEAIDALVPQFIAKLPTDVMNGQPLKYRRTDDGQFILYSVGQNQKDDGGQIALRKGGGSDMKNGDWVWHYPSK